MAAKRNTPNGPKSFAEMAAMPVDDLPEVLKLPAGHYVFEVARIPEEKPTKDNKGVMVNYACRVVAPVEDFDNPDELAEYTAKAGSVTGTMRTKGFYYQTEPKDGQELGDVQKQNARAMQDIVKFLRDHCQAEGSTVTEMNSAVVMCRFIGEIKHVPDRQNAENMVEEFGSTAPLE